MHAKRQQSIGSCCVVLNRSHHATTTHSIRNCTMSWDSYISHLMVDLPGSTAEEPRRLKSAGIMGQDGGEWAKSEGFPSVTLDQVKSIMAGFDSIAKDGHAGALGGTGILLGDQKFQVAPGDETVIRGKSKGGGCCIKKTATALVIGIYEEPVQPGDCNVVVENLGDYLSQSGY